MSLEPLSWTSDSPFNESESEPTSTHTTSAFSQRVWLTTFKSQKRHRRLVNACNEYSLPIQTICWSWFFLSSRTQQSTHDHSRISHSSVSWDPGCVQGPNYITLILSTLFTIYLVEKYQTIYRGFEIIIIQEDLRREVAYSRPTLFRHPGFAVSVPAMWEDQPWRPLRWNAHSCRCDDLQADCTKFYGQYLNHRKFSLYNMYLYIIYVLYGDIILIYIYNICLIIWCMCVFAFIFKYMYIYIYVYMYIYIHEKIGKAICCCHLLSI